MAAKNILSQLNIVEVAALTDSGTAFIGFGAKADGLYMKNGAGAEKRLLTTDDSVGTDFVPYTGAIANLNMGAFGILATNIAASGTAPDISCTKTSTGNIATLTASGTTTGYPRGSFLIGSTDGDAISNVGLTIAADISSAVQKPVFVEVKTNVLSSVSCMRLALKQSTTLAEIIASSNSGSTVGTPISIYTYGNSNQLYINTNGRIGFGTASPTATVHIKAGSATANTAPLKFTSGALLTAPEAGAFEFLTDGLYFTITTGTARKQLEFVGHWHTTANLTDWAAATASYVTGTPWTGMGYLTSQISHADVLVDGDFANQGIMLRGASAGVYSILADNSANWNTAFGWGNHSGLYSLLAHTHSGYQSTLSGTGLVKSTAGVISYDTNTYVTGTPWTSMGYVTGTPWTGMGYLTSQISHADVVVDGDFASQGIMLRGASAGVYSILLDNSANWNTAFGWGNHSGLYTVIGDRGLVRVGFGSATYGYLDTTYFNNVSGSIEMKLKTVGGSTIFGTGDVPFVVPNASVTYPKLSVYNGASQGNCLTYDSTYGLTWTAMATLSHTHSGVYEPVLWNPTTSGYVLSSTTAGVRSWVAQSSSYSLPLAANGTRGGVQLGYSNYYGTIGITLSGEQLVCILTKSTIEYALTGNISSHTHSYEPTLGNPGTNGYVLSSTTAGVRSWVAAGGGYTLPATGIGSLGGIKLGFTATGAAVPLQTSSDMGFVTVSKASVEYVLTGAISTHTHSYAPINGSSSNAFATANLSVTGTISASSTITGSEVYRGSSRTLKKDIADFDFDAIGFLNDVSIKRYSLKSNNLFGIGFIAEDTHPWLSGEDQKSHVFGNHLGLLTKAIQEEDQKVEDLKLEVLDLRARVRELEIARANGWN